MARRLQLGSSDYCTPTISWVLEENDVIVDRKKLTDIFEAAGIQLADLLIEELNVCAEKLA